NSGLIDALRKAGAIARDGEEGYRRAAEDIDDWQLRSTLLELARGRGEQADEIERLLQAYGQSLPKGGTAVGALHRTFLDLKSATMGNNGRAIFDELVRGESHAESVYDEALRSDLPTNVRQVLQRQHESVRQSRNRMRRMQQDMSYSEGGIVQSIGD